MLSALPAASTPPRPTSLAPPPNTLRVLSPAPERACLSAEKVRLHEYGKQDQAPRPLRQQTEARGIGPRAFGGVRPYGVRAGGRENLMQILFVSPSLWLEIKWFAGEKPPNMQIFVTGSL